MVMGSDMGSMPQVVSVVSPPSTGSPLVGGSVVSSTGSVPAAGKNADQHHGDEQD